MNADKVNDIPNDVTTFKILRFYHMFNPKTTKIYNYNIYQLAVIVTSGFILCISFYGLLGFFIKMEDTVDDIGLFQIIYAHLQIFLSIFKIIMLIYNADKIWHLLDITRPNFITNKLNQKDIKIQHDIHHRIKNFSNFLCILFTFVIILWSIFPFIFNSFTIKSSETIQRFENVINLRFPVTTKVFNDYYYFFYVMEVSMITFVGYTIIIFDTFLIIYISNVFIALYKINMQAFKIIGHQQQFKNGKLMAFL